MTRTAQPAPQPLGLHARFNRVCEDLWPTLQAEWAAAHPGGRFSLEVLAQIDSTSSELMRRVRQGDTEPTVLVAVDQTAGRGRRGHTWTSRPGDSLTVSIGLPLAPAQWSGLSLAVGVSLAESLAPLLAPSAQDIPPAGGTPPHTPPVPGRSAAAAPLLRLKWPNDLWLDDQKLGGVLVETAHAGEHRHAVVGLGLNLAVPTGPLAGPAGGVQPPAVAPTGLWRHAPELDAAQVLHAVLPPLLRDLLAFEALGFSAFAQRFAARDRLKDQAVWLSDGRQGTGCGVDDDGSLRVLTPDGLQTLHSADVSVRPLPLAAAPTAKEPPC